MTKKRYPRLFGLLPLFGTLLLGGCNMTLLDPVGQVGINFLKFCAKHQLANLTKAAREHAEYLNAGYAR